MAPLYKKRYGITAVIALVVIAATQYTATSDIFHIKGIERVLFLLPLLLFYAAYRLYRNRNPQTGKK